MLVKPYTANLIFRQFSAREGGGAQTYTEKPTLCTSLLQLRMPLNDLSKEERWKCELKAAASHNLRNGDSRRCDDAGWPPVERKWMVSSGVREWMVAQRAPHSCQSSHPLHNFAGDLRARRLGLAQDTVPGR